MSAQQPSDESVFVRYRFGMLHAERKDLDVTHVDQPDHVNVDLDFDVKAFFNLESAEADITVERDVWDSNIAVRVKGIFEFSKPFSSVDEAKEFVKSTALVRTIHVCLAELDRLARELDVSALAVPLEIEQPLRNVNPVYVDPDET